MEEEDEFGDLYTDVISSFPSSAEGNSKDLELDAAPEEPANLNLGTQGICEGGNELGVNDEDWSSSDSEDDLQIVLNDTNPTPPIHSNDDDDDEQPCVEPDWGDDVSATAAHDAAVAAAKPVSAPPRTNPFHSQYKYVRPGAAPMPGRGRADWRPPALKAFHPGNVPPLGLDFTLPSHKTIFDVDIDNFEEKPWKFPGVDGSDYFNFNLNEESWKDYYKQLEQLRLESMMQSKIRVYESGRAEQEYDPDLPPELAAAAAINDSSAENADIAKTDGGLGDPAIGAAHTRPLLPTGRAIQVETGFGERLPSVDSRPPRTRDSDAVIEIVLQNSVDDDSSGNGNTAKPDNDYGREDELMDAVDEDGPFDGDKHFDAYPLGCETMEDVAARKRSPLMGSPHAAVQDTEKERSSPEKASSDHSGSKGRASTEDAGSPCEERWTKEIARERSPHISSGESAHNRRSLDYQREDSADSLGQKCSPESLSPAHVEEGVKGRVEGKSIEYDDIAPDYKYGKGKEDGNVFGSTDTPKNKRMMHPTQQKLSRWVEAAVAKDVDDGEDLKTSRSNDSSKPGRSRDHQKRRESIDDKAVQNDCSAYIGDVKRHRGKGGHVSKRKELDGRMEMDRNYVSAKGREDYYSHKEWDPYTGYHFHVKPEGGDRRRERDFSEASWQRQDEDPHGRKIKAEDARKQESGDEMVFRHKIKVREIDRSGKVEYLQSQKFSENGSRCYHEKEAGLHHREKDDILKGRREILVDHHGKRRKDDDDHLRSGHVDKREASLGLRESSSTRGKRERGGGLNQRKLNDHPRVRDSYDDHHTVRLKDEVWVHKERAELQRDSDEWYGVKQSYEDKLSRRDREEGRAPVRSSRSVDDKLWAGHSQGREEYKGQDKDAGRHGEQLKRRERVEEEISLQHQGSEGVYAHRNHVSEGKRPRLEKSAAQNDRAASAANNQKFHEKKRKDNFKKDKESEGHSTSRPSKRHQGEKGVANVTEDVKGVGEKAVAEHDASLHNLSKEGREGVSSDDEQQDSKRGRSKLERWASHKERDYDINSKSSSLKSREISNRNVSGSTTAVRDESAKNVEIEDSNHSLAAVKESGGGSVDARPKDRQHLDTVEKLKRRSERFKLPLATEKDTAAIKIENEPLHTAQKETPVNSEVKQERPPRKRRWVSS